MSVVAIASAKGSPGVTMTGIALASQWPRRLAFADVDPAGGDVLWRARDCSGSPLDPDRGLLSLAAAARRGAAETHLGDHVQETNLGFPVLVGVPSPEQLSGMAGVWSHLTEVLAAYDGDVIVDCGRIAAGSPALSVFLKADVALFVARPDLEGVAHLRQLLHTLSGPLRLGQYGGPQVGVAVATSYRDTRAVGDLQRLLDSEGLGVRVLGITAHDPKAAQLYSSVRQGSAAKTLLGRSAKSLAEQLSRSPVTEPGRS